MARIFLPDLEPGLRASSQPRFLFEAMLIRLAALGSVRPIEELLQSLPAHQAPSPPTKAPPQKKKTVEPPEPPTVSAAPTQPA